MSEVNEKKIRDVKYDNRLICKYGVDCYCKNFVYFVEY